MEKNPLTYRNEKMETVKCVIVSQTASTDYADPDFRSQISPQQRRENSRLNL